MEWSMKGLRKKVPFEVDLERQLGVCQVERGKEDLPGQRCRGGDVHTHLGTESMERMWVQRSNGGSGWSWRWGPLCRGPECQTEGCGIAPRATRRP